MSRRPNLQPPSIARHLCLRWSSAIAVCWLAISPAFAQEIGKLYATRPPPGSAFIRVASIGDIKADTRLHINARDLSIVDNDAAS